MVVEDAKIMLTRTILCDQDKGDFKPSPQQLYAFQWTKVYVVKKMCPFSLTHDPDICNMNSIVNASFPKKLNSENFRLHILDMYDATE